MAEKVTLQKNTQTVELETKDASVGPSVIDLKNLYHDTGYFTLIHHIQLPQAAKVPLHILMVRKEFWNTEVIQ